VKDFVMDILPIGSVQSWLAVVGTTLSPLIALIVGFAGTDWWFRWQISERCENAPLEGAEGADD
jgi:hypothetical protein